MKDFFIDKSTQGVKINAGDSLPPVIRMGQYSYEIATESDASSKEKTFYERIDSGMGTMGNKNFDFGIDCRHYPLEYENETSAFQWINNQLAKSIYPVFRKEDIVQRFYVIAVPDYGHQAMSPFYRDFVPHVYFNGYKIWQKYIGMIKHYSRKTAYILIDKTVFTDGSINNAPASEKTPSDPNESGIFNIRICFKNNIEKAFTGAENNQGPALTLTISDIADGKEDCIFKAENVDIVYSNAVLGDSIRNIDDYVIEALDADNDNNTTLKGIYINPIFIKRISITPNVSDLNTGNTATCYTTITQQTPISINNNVQINQDYFKQAYQRDYLGNYNIDDRNNINDYVRDTSKVDISIEMPEGIQAQEKKITAIRIRSKQNLYNAAYGTSLSAGSELGTDITTAANVNIFNTAGERLESIPEENKNKLDELEFVPEYNSVRKIVFTSDKSLTYDKIKHVFPNLIRWDLEDFNIAYSSDGVLKNSIELSEDNNGVYTFIVYDYGGNERAGTYGNININDQPEINISVSTDAVPFNNVTPASEWNVETDQYKIYTNDDENDVSYGYIEFKQVPLSCYLHMKNPANTLKQAQMVAHNFIIPLEIEQLDTYTVHLMLPAYFRYLIAEKKLSKSFLYSLEPVIFVNKKSITDGDVIYNIEHLNAEVSADTMKVAHPLNIVNFNGRNTETKSTESSTSK